MLQFLSRHKTMPTAEEALPGRDQAIVAPGEHFVLGTPMAPPFPDGTEQVVLGMGCFWGAERMFWERDRRVHHRRRIRRRAIRPTRPTRRSARGGPATTRSCSWSSGPAEISYEELLRSFWESHDPTQGMRQGNDVGHPVPLGYLHTSDAAAGSGARSRAKRYAKALAAAGHGGEISTEILPRRRVLLRRGLPPAVPRARTLAATAGSAAPACPAPWASPAEAPRARPGAPPPGRGSA